MCFSASGSFVSAGVLGAIGVLCLRQCPARPLRLFAAVPLLFAAQQAAEGVVWLSLAGTAAPSLQQLGMDVFLGFALLVWPVWLPLALRQAEPDVIRRRALLGLLGFGAATAAYAAAMLVRTPPFATIAGHSIRYVYAIGPQPLHAGLYLALYMIPTVAPFFLSSVQFARTMGVGLLLSAGLAILVERDALTSVWCFFAALLSMLVFLSVTRQDSRAAVQAPAI
jgi:hypothetical protein